MASATATHKWRSRNAARTYIHNPATATTAEVVAWVDMSLYGSFAALVAFVSGTGVLTFRIMASASSNGSSAVEVKAHAAPTDADAEDDNLSLECTSEELAILGASLRYVGVEMDMDHADDICAVTYVRAEPRFAQESLTPNSVIDGVAA